MHRKAKTGKYSSSTDAFPASALYTTERWKGPDTWQQKSNPRTVHWWRNESWAYWVSTSLALNHKLVKGLRVCYKLALQGVYYWTDTLYLMSSFVVTNSSWLNKFPKHKDYSILLLRNKRGEICFQNLMGNSFPFWPNTLWLERWTARPMSLYPWLFRCLPHCRFLLGGSMAHQPQNPAGRICLWNGLLWVMKHSILLKMLTQEQNRA